VISLNSVLLRWKLKNYIDVEFDQYSLISSSSIAFVPFTQFTANETYMVVTETVESVESVWFSTGAVPTMDSKGK